MLYENDMKTLQTNKEGRPTKLTDDVVNKLENIFKVGGNVEEAISYAGISKQTYYNWIEADISFLTKMDAARHYADIVAKNVVIDAIVKDRDLGTAKWWLEKREFKNTTNNTTQILNQGEMTLEFFGNES